MENTKDKSYLVLESPHLLRNILLLALPIMFSNILKSVHDIVDMYFVGHLDLEVEKVDAMVSAITVTNPIIAIFQALATGLMIAGAALMSQYLGGKHFTHARRVNAQLLIMCFGVGLIFNVILYFTTGPILQLMGALDKPLVYEYSKEYVCIRSFEMTGLFIFFAYQANRQSLGDTVSPVILNVISIILNIILTGILVKRFYLKGAAYATVIANMIIIPICIVLYFKTKNEKIRLKWKDLIPNFKVIKQIFILGLPAALSQAFSSLGFLIINSIILDFEPYIITGIGVGNRINSILLFPVMAIGSILATFVGQNVGAENVERTRKSVWASLFLSLIITIIGALFLYLLRIPLVELFIPNRGLAFDSCLNYLYFLVVGLPLMGIFQVFIGAFQGAGRTGFSLILSSFRLWVLRIPVIIIYIYVFGLKEESVWYAMIISNFGASILGTILYQFVDFKPRIDKMKERVKKQINNSQDDLKEEFS